MSHWIVTVLGLVALLAIAVSVAMLIVHRRWIRTQEHSRAVHGWRPGAGATVSAGELHVRVHGAAPALASEAVLLLHGLATAGEYWGGAFDESAGDGTLVVPDMLGFGRSVDRRRPAARYGIDDHVGSLEAMLETLGFRGARLTLAGHSVGGIAALHLAQHLLDRGDDGALVTVDRVVLLAPPLHDDYETAVRFVQDRAPLARLFTIDRRSARWFRQTVFRYPVVARLVSRLLAPGLPVAITDQSVLHTWDSYIGTFRSLLGDRSWRQCIDRLVAAGIPVTIGVGRRDTTVERDLYRSIPGVEVVEHHDGGHQLPLVAGEWCAALLAGAGRPIAPGAR